MTPWSHISLQWNWNQDGWIVAIGILAAVASSLVGSFLVLRKMSMLGDAISHAVLPGLAIAFLLSHSRDSSYLIFGAVAVGLLTAFLTQWISQWGKVDEGASMGVVFTSLFALGLLLMELTAKSVDLDPDCVLYGNIVLNPLDTIDLWGWAVPRAAVRLAIVCSLNLAFVIGFYKELKIAAFDPALATTMGYSATLMHYALMTLVAITTVACFESVGNILVIAMMIVPTATALLLSERLSRVLLLAILLATASAILGHLSSIIVPQMLQRLHPIWANVGSTHMPGMMAVVSGLLFFLATFLAPKQGLLIRWIHRRRLASRILREDLLATLFKTQEAGKAPLTTPDLQRLLLTSALSLRWVLISEQRRGNLTPTSHQGWTLTPKGIESAKQTVRSHRLWEYYLVDKAQVPSDRIHAQAEKLEHFTTQQMQSQLHEESNAPRQDPHGRNIPEA